MYPISGNWETRQSGVTTIKKAWADATDASLNGIYGGTLTVVAVTIDGIGGQPQVPVPGRITAAEQLVAGAGITSLGGNVTVIDHDILALTGHFGVGETRSSATLGAGQSVAHGEIYNDTTCFAWGRVKINPVAMSPADCVLIRGVNVATVTRAGTGLYDVTLQTAAAHVLCPRVTPLSAVPIYMTVDSSGVAPTTTTFRVLSFDKTGNPVDTPGVDGGFYFDVKQG